MPLNVLAIADQVDRVLYDHFQRERWHMVDLILSCGDLPPDYLSFLCSSLDVPVLYVRGNHDEVYEEEKYDGCDNVHGRIATCKGLRVAGFQGCYRYNHGGLQYSESEMRRMVRRSRFRALRTGAPHLVLTHAPPAGCHEGADRCHRGFECFQTLIDTWKPAFFLHGHVHAYERHEASTQVRSTMVINPYPYQVFQIPDAVLERGMEGELPSTVNQPRHLLNSTRVY